MLDILSPTPGKRLCLEYQTSNACSPRRECDYPLINTDNRISVTKSMRSDRYDANHSSIWGGFNLDLVVGLKYIVDWNIMS